MLESHEIAEPDLMTKVVSLIRALVGETWAFIVLPVTIPIASILILSVRLTAMIRLWEVLPACLKVACIPTTIRIVVPRSAILEIVTSGAE